MFFEKKEKLLLWHLKKKSHYLSIFCPGNCVEVMDMLCIWIFVFLFGQS